MAKGLICDRCGKVTTHYGDINEIAITPYCGIKAVSSSASRSIDLCKDCTNTVMQYINGEVDMVIFNDRRAADDQTDNSHPGI